MALIYEGKYFVVESAERPLVSREKGGHVVITPKRYFEGMEPLTLEEGIEQIDLQKAIGTIMVGVLRKNGVPIKRANQQINMNWNPQYKIHSFGTITDEINPIPSRRRCPDFYNGFVPLTEQDVRMMRERFEERFS